MRSKQGTNDRDVEENTNHQNNGTELELESVNGAFRLMAEQVSQKEVERWENDQWFQKSEKGCLERMSCDAR